MDYKWLFSNLFRVSWRIVVFQFDPRHLTWLFRVNFSVMCQSFFPLFRSAIGKKIFLHILILFTNQLLSSLFAHFIRKIIFIFMISNYLHSSFFAIYFPFQCITSYEFVDILNVNIDCIEIKNNETTENDIWWFWNLVKWRRHAVVIPNSAELLNHFNSGKYSFMLSTFEIVCKYTINW